MTPGTGWPALPYEAWEPTKQTLHRFVQIVGKVRMALVPFRNHWWHATLSVSARGLTTGPMHMAQRTAEIELDLVEHRVQIRTSDRRTASFPLHDGLPCARFYAELFAALAGAGVEARIDPRPFDLEGPPFPEDTLHDSYDADAVERFAQVLRRTDAVLARFASRFNGKASPAQLFWHGFDLAHARFSGRRTPAAAAADAVTAEAYSHEVIAFGWWPGDDRTTPHPAFYSYTAPEPEGLRGEPLEPRAAVWQEAGNGSLAVLPYDAVRETADPEDALLGFYESAYRAGTARAGWDAAALDTGRR